MLFRCPKMQNLLAVFFQLKNSTKISIFEVNFNTWNMAWSAHKNQWKSKFWKWNIQTRFWTYLWIIYVYILAITYNWCLKYLQSLVVDLVVVGNHWTNTLQQRPHDCGRNLNPVQKDTHRMFGRDISLTWKAFVWVGQTRLSATKYSQKNDYKRFSNRTSTQNTDRVS